MIFASRHLSAHHALSLRLWSWLELIDLAFLLLPPPSLSPAEQPDGEKQNGLAPTGYLQRSSENTELDSAVTTISVHRWGN